MEKICVRYFKIYYLCKAKGKRELFPVDGMIFKPYIIKKLWKRN